MFQFIRTLRAEKRARNAQHLALLEVLIEENRRQMEALAEVRECKWCAADETPEQREVCEKQFSATR